MRAKPYLLATLTLLLLLQAGYAFAALPKSKTTLLLEVWINGHTKHDIVEAMEQKGKLMVDSVCLASSGIKFDLKEVPPSGLIAADGLPGVTMTLQTSEQKLEITATPERLQPQVFELSLKSASNITPSGTGFIGQYDVIGTVDNFDKMSESSSTGAVVSGTYFTPSGNYSASALAESQNQGSRFVRFDTSYERDDLEHTRRFVAGDAISGSQSWSRSVRFGGVQLATDFGLRPDISTMPLPAFFGQTAVPANVDIFVNSSRVFEGGVEPGAFQINNLPIITGSGEASMVVRNALGQETVVTVPFYASNALLRPGLSSYDIDAGFVRTAYGVDSFSYRDAFMNGSYSYGASNWLTLESHVEAAKGVQLAGGGAVFALSSFGTLHLASAFSHNSERNDGYGAQHSIALETEMQPIGFFTTLNSTSGHYADIASIDSTPPPELQLQLGSHAALGDYGAVAGSYITIHRENQQQTRLTTASYTHSISGRFNFGATGFYDLTHKETVFQGFLSMSLGDNVIADSNVAGGNRTHTQEAGITKPVNPDGGFGYHVSATHGDNTIKEGTLSWIGQHGGADIALASRNEQQAARLTASGGVVVMEGEIYATQRPNGSVALVETGTPGTPIYHENRQVATADENGKALITGLVPFSPNHISIDPSKYKLSELISTLDKTVIPGRQNGVTVDFSPTPQSPAVVLLRMPDGTFPHVGATVVLKDNPQPLVVGRHGEMFIADLKEPVSGVIDDGKTSCHFNAAPVAAKANAIPRIGSVTCTPDQATQ